MQIYITSWHRLKMTIKTISYLKTRTTTPYQITIFDNGSSFATKHVLLDLQNKNWIDNIIFMKENTGCLYNKFIFHAMTTSDEKYYIVTDNDVYPPKLDTCWLKQMTDIMDEHEELAILALQLPPQQFQQPYSISSDGKVFYCKAVGNTFKMVRRSALEHVFQTCAKPNNLKGAYGDDSLFSNLLTQAGYKIGFTADLWCLHGGQCENWGYSKEQINKDPRKAGYGEHFRYEYNNLTFEPIDNRYKIIVV